MRKLVKVSYGPTEFVTVKDKYNPEPYNEHTMPRYREYESWYEGGQKYGRWHWRAGYSPA